MSKTIRGKRNGTGPYKGSYQSKLGVGRRKQKGEECPSNSSVPDASPKGKRLGG